MESVETAEPTKSATMSRLLLECSHELLHNILTSVDPADLAALTLSCRTLRTFIRDNTLLHKELYMQRWDPPLTSDFDYRSSLHSLVRLTEVFRSDSLAIKQASLEASAASIIPLLSRPSARNTAFLAKHFADQKNIDAFLARSRLYHHAGSATQTAASTPAERQLSARLHTLYGIPVDHERRPATCPHRAPPPAPGTAMTGGLPGQRSPYHILYRRQPMPDASAGAEDDPGTSSHFLRSSTRVPPNNVARAKVYDLREYTDASLWGPFMADGSQRVDWQKMEAIMVLLGYNLGMFAERTPAAVSGLWYGAWEGVSPGSFREPDWGKGMKEVVGLSRLAVGGGVVKIDAGEEADEDEENQQTRLQKELDDKDPYGVSGTWMRVVCFLDYNDLYAFNFTGERERQGHRGIDTREAIRLIKLTLKVTKVEYDLDDEADSDSSSDYSSDQERLEARYAAGPTASSDAASSSRRQNEDTPMKGQQRQTMGDKHPFSHWPKVSFVGTSRSLHASWDPNANSRIRGVVRMTRHGDVRWTTWSIFHGEERWRSEGVQVGGPKSGRGVLGNWFDKDFELQGPAGPTAFWKVSGHDIEDQEEDPGPVRALPFLWPLDGDGGDDDEDSDDLGGLGPSREAGEERGDDGEVRAEEEESDQEGVGEEGYGDVEVIDEESMGVEFVVEDVRDHVVAEETGEGQAHLGA